MKKIRKAGPVVLAAIFVMASLSIVSQLYIQRQASLRQAALDAAASRSEFTAEEIGEDIDYLRYLLTAVHPGEIQSFPLPDILPQLDAFAASVGGPMTRRDLYLALAPILASMNDEHASVFPPASSADSRLFPLAVAFVGGRIFVTRVPPGDTATAPGHEIVSINGVAAAALQRNLAAFHSGTRDAQKFFYAQEAFGADLAAVYDFEGVFDVIFRDPLSNEMYERPVAGSVRTNSDAAAFSFRRVARDTMLFTYTAFEDIDNEFPDFLDDLFETMHKERMDKLVIDIRRNRGGAAAFGDDILGFLSTEPWSQLSRVDVRISEEARNDFIANVPAAVRWLPVRYFHPLLRPLWAGTMGEVASVTFDAAVPAANPLRFEGDIYLLIGPGTMSSASLFAATLKAYGLATLVGESTGGFATMYGNVIDAYLPNTKLKVWMPTSVVHGNSQGPVEPHYRVAQSAADRERNTDTVLQYALALAETVSQ